MWHKTLKLSLFLSSKKSLKIRLHSLTSLLHSRVAETYILMKRDEICVFDHFFFVEYEDLCTTLFRGNLARPRASKSRVISEYYKKSPCNLPHKWHYAINEQPNHHWIWIWSWGSLINDITQRGESGDNLFDTIT